MAETVHSPIVAFALMLSLLALCPPFVILLWFTRMVLLFRPLASCGRMEFKGSSTYGQDPLPSLGRLSFATEHLRLLFSFFFLVKELKAQFLQRETDQFTRSDRWLYLSSGIFNPAIVYDHLGAIFSALIFGCFIFCVLLYVKVHVAPSSSDSGSCGNLIIDFYWGMELYPRIGKNFDIKVFTNCRFGMMSWAVLAVTYCIKQYEINGRVSDSMLVNTILMHVYVTKFFGWEAGYWNSMDIAHDRAGFYICWGCLVWVPSIYTSPGMYLVNHPVQLGTQLAIYILVAGILCIYINYDCDRQRQEFRRTNGKCSVWGKAPSKIVATYKTTASETKTSLLLTSGW
uniref:7-dehydrocholesterol reductase n=1 Tax=Brassica campestris TaxID=3711 RepID=M4FIU9_BRACM